ncbi:PEP-CTERM sorting domain-containing protein [Massilia sp. Dwa41.01b]|uniref:PEP-CTERM sorting domain-containing protein n=1 Tax=unclassified Massilia TaxID=2609279 RepID=UPI0016030CA0|nr:MULTISPECIES: PEP-CTERM sorting domain-containing protein [unclassified Massilia]QNA87350.1 PEP-CTERM sorting domain-containing protein [Massilia sp. Dwa41.01b]QNA98257.1 PEP-CTERM sorting domain-containing protein [Massilia sp. Se16.2.3]
MKIQRILKQLFVAGALVAGVSQAQAGVMTFSDLVDFENYSEAGMDMYSSDVWNWPEAQMAHIDFGEAGFVLNSGAQFNLNSIDLLADGGGGTARFSAYLDGELLGWIDVATAGTYAFGNLFQGIDELRVSVIDNHFSFDNLVFNEDGSTDVPEPTSVALLGMGMLALAARRRKQA